MPSRRLLIWAVACGAYVVGMFHRSSMAVAGLEAVKRFDIGPAALSLFVALQIAVYAGMQIPAGGLIDRFGPRRGLVVGSVGMAIGQLLFSEARSVALAVAARVLVGCGDALIFICVLKLVAGWFPESSVPWMNQATGLAGQLGALVSAAPMTVSLAHLGWTTTYQLASVMGLVIALLVVVVVRDPASPRERAMSRLATGELVREMSRLPHVRLGFWIHGATSFSSIAFMLIWGHPFLVEAQGQSALSAGRLLGVGAAGLMLGGIAFGRLSSSRPAQRVSVAQSVVAMQLVAWATILVWPGMPPFAILAVFVLVLGFGTPCSLFGFDVARSAAGSRGASIVIALVNQSGFVLALLQIMIIGMIVQVGEQLGWPEGPTFEWAMASQGFVWAYGFWRIRSLSAVERAVSTI